MSLLPDAITPPPLPLLMFSFDAAADDAAATLLL